MKYLLFIIFTFHQLQVFGQNEFAATAFYTSFNIIEADAKNGFEATKGELLDHQPSGFANEYKVKLMIPLAESGKIVEPVSGNPYAVYFFEPEKKKEKIDKRAVQLREAILTALGLKLYAKTIFTTVNNHILSDTYLYVNPDELSESNALFKISIFYDQNRFQLLLEIRGNRVEIKNAAVRSIFISSV